MGQVLQVCYDEKDCFRRENMVDLLRYAGDMPCHHCFGAEPGSAAGTVDCAFARGAGGAGAAGLLRVFFLFVLSERGSRCLSAKKRGGC